jgi:ribosomal protein S12 methylthiotransferase
LHKSEGELKTKQWKKDRVNIVTLGCSKNLVDSEILLTQLKGNKINAVHESESDDANIVIINTCGFIDNAKQESIDTILRYADAKSDGQVEKVYVTGCLSQRYRDELSLEIPQVDAWFGTMELPLLLKKFKADYKRELLGERILTTNNHYAYLKISEGCDRPCSFCAIPLMRGKHVSKPMEDLVKEAASLARQGTKELLIIAQDSTYYGLDLYRKRKLAELLDRLSDVEGIEWIRLHYAFPTGFPEDVLDVMHEKPTICNYLDIPLQHGSTKMLQLMRRGITREKTEDLIKKIRDKVPDVALRTTLIAGHPGETEFEFNEMLKFVEESRFERLGVFTYSHEEGTHAHQMQDDIPEEEKQNRANRVMELQESISEEINAQKVGKTFKVLIDRMESDYYVGRTEYDSPEVDNEVIIRTNDHLRIGDFVNVQISDSSPFDLYGVPSPK